MNDSKIFLYSVLMSKFSINGSKMAVFVTYAPMAKNVIRITTMKMVSWLRVRSASLMARFTASKPFNSSFVTINEAKTLGNQPLQTWASTHPHQENTANF